MRILLIHNFYKQAGGEDAVFYAEKELLKSYGHEVETIKFHNYSILNIWDEISTAICSYYNIKSSQLLKKKFIKNKPDIIHVHNFFPLASPSIFYVAHNFKVPIVMTLHNYRLICPSSILYFNGRIYEKSIKKIFPFDAVIKGVYRNSTIQTFSVASMVAAHNLLGTWGKKINYFIVLTEFAKNKFVNSSLKVNHKKFIIKPNFVNDYGYNIKGRKDYYLYIGRLSEEKGIHLLLKLIKETNFKTKIIGDGPLKKHVLEYEKQYNNLEYLGYKDKPFIIQQLKMCKALLFPSFWYEGMPMTILEAFSTGTPVISTDIGGPAEIVKNGFNGMHFKNGSVDSLLTTIKEFDNSQNKYSLYQNARNTYEMKYSPEINYNHLINIYQTAIKEKIIYPEARVND